MTHLVEAARNRSEPQVARDAVTQHLCASIDAAALAQNPCTYTYLEQPFPGELYDRILASMPARESFHELRHRDAMRADGSSTRLRLYLFPENLWRVRAAQRPVWMQLAHALMSADVQDAFKRKFRASIESRFGRDISELSFFPIPILLRDQPGYRIGIHADTGSKAITVQFYLPSDTSQRHLGTIFHAGRDGEDAARTTVMDFMPNTGYAFPVVPQSSWHSVAGTQPGDGERRSLMLIYYVQEGARAWCKQRYDRLRCLLGVGPRG